MIAAKNVSEAHAYLREIRDIDICLGVGSRSAHMEIATFSASGMDTKTKFSLPDRHWRDALRAWRADLVQKLTEMGVDMSEGAPK